MKTAEQTWRNTELPTHQRVADLLAQMTLEEKAGQLGSYWIRPEEEQHDGENNVAPMADTFGGGPNFETAIKNGLGHITRAFGTIPLDPVQGRAKLAELQEQVIASNRFGIPAIAHEECLTGFTTLGATCYPASVAWGASFNPELVHSMAGHIGADMKKMGVHQGLSPVLDVVRDYRWGRVEETIGEDPHLVGELALAYVKGLQGSGVSATLKHFAGYAASQGGRNHAPVSLGQRALEDTVFPPFERAVREGKVQSVMNSYAEIDGEAPAASRRLLTEVLRERWGFTGTVVADYWSVSFLHSMHEIADSEDSAGLLALKAGMDVELPETIAFSNLAEAVRAGHLEEAILDQAVSRVLTQKVEAGLLDPDYSPEHHWQGDDVDLDSKQNRQLARTMAEESIILLRNEQILPLKNPARLAVIGPSATQPRTHLGCYSFTNHVYSRFAEQEDYGVEMTSILQALRESPALAGSQIEYARGVDFTDLDDKGIEQAVEVARNAEIAVVTVGDLAGLFGRGTSGEGCDVVDLKLPGRQSELVEAVLDTGTPTILVLVTGRPYALGEFADRAAGIVQCFMPGVEGGPAIAGVLTGEVNPSGKLPVQIPDHRGGQPGTYLVPKLGWHSDGISNLDPRPLYPFGYGLSYTSFEISSLQISSTQIATDGTVEVSARVTNTGSRHGAEAVQLYLSDEFSQVVRPRRWLAGFAKVSLDAGESKSVTFSVHADRTSFTGLAGTRIVEPGKFTAVIGSSSEDLGQSATFEIVGQIREVGEGRVMDTPVIIGK